MLEFSLFPFYHENLQAEITVLEKISTELAADEQFKEGPVLGVQSIDPNNLVLRVEGMEENGMQWGCERICGNES